MLGRIQRDLIKLLVLFGGLFLILYLVFFILIPSSKFSGIISEQNSHLLSYEKEIQLGDIIDKYAIKNQEIDPLSNKLIDSALWVISSRLKKQIPISEYDYKIKIIESQMINAFTIPGGRIYISKELISFCESPEQLAAVLAHEIAHVEKRHTVSRILKEFTISILFSIVGGRYGFVI